MRKYLFLFAIIINLLIAFQAEAQEKKRKKSSPGDRDKKFLRTQWWLGPRGGLNLTSVSQGDKFTAFNSTVDPSNKSYNKEYKNFSIPGGQAGMEITFVTHGFSVSFQPNYRRQSFFYSSPYSQNDPKKPSNNFTMKYDQNNYLDFFEFPLLVKYDFLKGDWKPFIQAGAFYGLLTNASKSVKVVQTDNTSGKKDEYIAEEFTIGTNDLYNTSSFGAIGGIGVSYDIGNIRFIFDVNYKFGLTNITDASNRFSNNRLIGIGDALDDMKLRNLSFSLGCLFPLRFLSSSYEAAD